MPAKKYRVTLTKEEQTELKELVSKGKTSARKLTRARILLLANEKGERQGYKDAEIVAALGVSRPTVERTRRVCVEEGIEAALKHKRAYRRRGKVVDGEVEARLIALACSDAPEGREKWTMQMLADKLIELDVVETISDETVRTTLKKTNLSHG